jgi:hypothetical protein
MIRNAFCSIIERSSQPKRAIIMPFLQQELIFLILSNLMQNLGIKKYKQK